MMVDLGIYTNAIGWTYPDLRSVWVEADRLGFTTAQLMDNTIGPDIKGQASPVFEAYTTLSALAEATQGIQIGPLSTPSIRRHPALLAKMTSILDRISDGRLILTIGAGDEAQHFVPWGMDFPDTPTRVEMLEDALQIIRGLWGEEAFDFTGRHFTLLGAVNEPKPVPKPGRSIPPIWIGLGVGRRLMPKLVGRYADGFNIYAGDEDRVSEVYRAIEDACRENNRDIGQLTRSRHVMVTLSERGVNLDELYANQADMLSLTPNRVQEHYTAQLCHVAGTPEDCVAHLQRVVASGFNHLALQFQGVHDAFGGSADETIRSMRLFMSRVAPHLG